MTFTETQNFAPPGRKQTKQIRKQKTETNVHARNPFEVFGQQTI